MIKIAFVGSIIFSRDMLRHLAEHLPDNCEIVHVLGLAASESTGVSDYADLKAVAAELRVPYKAFSTINGYPVHHWLQCLRPDYTLVMGLSQIIRPDTLALMGTAIGSHPTLLPEGRGHAGLPWAILKGLTRTGLSFFYLAEGVDTGDIYHQFSWPIEDWQSVAELYHVMCNAGKVLINHLCYDLGNGAPLARRVMGTPGSLWPRRTPADARIDFSKPAEDIMRHIRACQWPYPVAFTEVGRRKMLFRMTEGRMVIEDG